MRLVRPRGIGWLGLTFLFLLAALATAFAPARSVADADEPDGEPVLARVSQASRLELRGDFLALTNEDRAERDRADLRVARAASRYATQHSREMAELGVIYHSTEDELRGALEAADWSVAGENVGVGASLEGLQRAFMESPVHSRNVLNGSFDHAAIGVVVAYDRIWITVVFYGD
jgi:uncharacterized protein YkwD